MAIAVSINTAVISTNPWVMEMDPANPSTNFCQDSFCSMGLKNSVYTSA